MGADWRVNEPPAVRATRIELSTPAPLVECEAQLNRDSWRHWMRER